MNWRVLWRLKMGERGGIVVNNKYQTSVENIYAIGGVRSVG